MIYKMKLKLNKNQYLAVLEKALVIVTIDDNGKFKKAVIFNKEV